MATAQSARHEADAFEEELKAQALQKELRRQQMKDLLATALTGAFKVLGIAFAGAIAGYSASIASENYKSYKARKDREQAKLHAQDVHFVERS